MVICQIIEVFIDILLKLHIDGLLLLLALLLLLLDDILKKKVGFFFFLLCVELLSKAGTGVNQANEK